MKRLLSSIIALAIIAPMFVLTGCSVTLGEFSTLSTKNYDPDLEYRSAGIASGKSKSGYLLVFIPLQPVQNNNFEDAIDQALAEKGGVFLANAKVEFYNKFYIIYSENGYRVTGEVYAPVSRSEVPKEGEERFTLVETEEGYALRSKTTGDLLPVQDITNSIVREN
ncbi:MAG: hypothetical protein AB7H80_17380 [Candidatus Kapaibacterium sp.]